MLMQAEAATQDKDRGVPEQPRFGQQWTPARAEQFDLSFKDSSFRVLISWPDAPPPTSGYGVIYAFDAAWTFATLRDVVTLRSRVMPDAEPTVVVAIGWPTDTLTDHKQRGADLAGRGGDQRMTTLGFLSDRLIPYVESRIEIDPRHRMLLGHSFGGAFVLWARQQSPEVFSHYAAGSPSIWSDPETLRPHNQPAGAGSLLISLGELEDADAAARQLDDPQRIQILRDRDMLGRARATAEAVGTDLNIYSNMDHGGALLPFLLQAFDSLWALEAE